MRSFLLAALVLAVAACGTTTILTEPGARIYVNGKRVGKGEAEIRQRGAPGSTTITVKTRDGRKARRTIKRSFTMGTAAVGLFTYGVGLLTYWAYPDVVRVSLPEGERTGFRNGRKPASGWGASGSTWDQAPAGWEGPRATQAAPSTGGFATPPTSASKSEQPVPAPASVPASANKPAFVQGKAAAKAEPVAPKKETAPAKKKKRAGFAADPASMPKFRPGGRAPAPKEKTPAEKNPE